MAADAGDPPAPSSNPSIFALCSIREALSATLRPEQAICHGTREAAVALILRELPVGACSSAPRSGQREAEGTELLLIRRAERMDDPWSGHMALPGGRRDPLDASLLDTARRETFEEVGLQLERDGTLIGRLPSLPAMAQGRTTGMTVAPLVFHLTGTVELRVNHEVAEVLWVRLQDLRSGALDTVVEYPLGGAQRPALRLPAWAIEGRIVWGLTHRMISTLFDLLERDPL
jgi:8-oxo-dGTP pyrophosphatase MutT (NUDIX family)